MTSQWWNVLWLNEGFATLFEYLLVKNIQPELRMDDFFNVQKLQNAFKVDALETSRPMTFDPVMPSGIREVFDAISYDKGG